MTRKRLDRGTVVAAAEELVDRNGWAYLTMTDLAENLGVRGPTLYSHVHGVEALLGEVQARALQALGLELQRSVMGRQGTDAVRAIAEALRAFATEHPGRYELAIAEPIDRPAVLLAAGEAGAAFGAVLRSFGLAQTSGDLAFTCLAMLHGVLNLERAGLFRQAEVGVDVDLAYERAVDAVINVIECSASEGGNLAQAPPTERSV
jgi:AcrR family transcriptional regulator